MQQSQKIPHNEFKNDVRIIEGSSFKKTNITHKRNLKRKSNSVKHCLRPYLNIRTVNSQILMFMWINFDIQIKSFFIFLYRVVFFPQNGVFLSLSKIWGKWENIAKIKKCEWNYLGKGKHLKETVCSKFINGI